MTGHSDSTGVGRTNGQGPYKCVECGKFFLPGPLPPACSRPTTNKIATQQASDAGLGGLTKGAAR